MQNKKNSESYGHDPHAYRIFGSSLRQNMFAICREAVSAESSEGEQQPEEGARSRKCVVVDPEPEPDPEPKQASLSSVAQSAHFPSHEGSLPAKDGDCRDSAEGAKLSASLHELLQNALANLVPFMNLQLRQKNESGSDCDSGGDTGDGDDGDSDAYKTGPESVSASALSISGPWPQANKPAGSECDCSDLVFVSSEEEDGPDGVVELDDDGDDDEAWDFETIERPPT